MPEPVTFRPRGGQIIAWAAIGVCALGLVFIALTDGLTGLVLWAWPIVLVAWLAWILYIRPCVQLNEGFIEIRNVFRTHRVPWGDVADVDSRYALTVRTTGGRSIRAWAAPAPSARQALTTNREEAGKCFETRNNPNGSPDDSVVGPRANPPRPISQVRAV